MIDGICASPPRVLFGPNATRRWIDEMARLGGGPILVHHGRASAEATGLLARLRAELRQHDMAWVEFGGVRANPQLALVREGVSLCRDIGVDRVLAVGGGSVIDSAKAIAAGARFDGDVLALMTGEAPIRDALPICAMPTVAGAGSESSPAAVISDPARGLKIDFASEHLRPRVAILDPTLTLSVGAAATLAGAFDATCHLLERYFSNTEDTDCSDRLIEALLLTLQACAMAVPERLGDYALRADLMWACKLAQDDFTGLGRKQDWASHTIAHAIGGLFDVSHGPLVTVVMIAWMKTVHARNPLRFVQLGRRAFDLPIGTDTAAATVDAFERQVAASGMPTRLSALGVALDGAACARVVAQCVQRNPSGTIGNFVRLTADDVGTILATAR